MQEHFFIYDMHIFLRAGEDDIYFILDAVLIPISHASVRHATQHIVKQHSIQLPYMALHKHPVVFFICQYQ